jgi:GH24 family phage-related lysozyme (muramidase)
MSKVNHAEFDTNPLWQFHPDAEDIQAVNSEYKEYLDNAYDKFMELNPDWYKEGNSSFYHTARNIIYSEGFRPSSYGDTRGHSTIGVGFKISSLTPDDREFLTDPERTTQDHFDFFVDYFLKNTIKEARELCTKPDLHPEKLSICAENVYNMGKGKFSGFKKTLQGINTGDDILAATEIVDNKSVKEALMLQKDPNLPNADGVLIRFNSYAHRLRNFKKNLESLNNNISSEQLAFE